MSRRVAAATPTVVVVGAGAGAAPAFADRAQRTAQLEWVAASGLQANTKGVTPISQREVRAGVAKLDRADLLSGHADELLAGDASRPAPKLP
jgi:hypothetical protein